MASPRSASRGLVFCLALALSVGVLTAPAMAGRQRMNENPTVLPPHSNPFGKSYGEWGAEWWRWALSIPAASNPILDATGASCDVAQSGHVWFLAGTGGASVTRECTIPVGKAVFFPILNYLADYPCPPEFGFEPAPGQSLGDFLTQTASDIIDLVDQLSVEVDGQPLDDLYSYRAASGPFRFTGDPSLAAVFDPCITGTEQDGASDGYWIMLPPLSSGDHSIHFTGGVSAFGFSIDVTYNLHVVPGSELEASSASAPGIPTAAGVSLKHAAAAAGMGPAAPQSGTTWGRLKIRYR